MKRSFRPTLGAACALLALAAATSAAHAAVYIPTKTADTAGGPCTAADCSLREALLAANAHNGDDVILLHAGVYALSIAGNEDAGAAGDLDVQDDLVIIGDGAASTLIDGGGIDRIFHVPAGVSLEIRDVTLRNGRASGDGGAILNAGDLTVLRGVLSGNTSLTGFGGAISTGGFGSSLTLADSTVASNGAQGGGGGIAAGGDVTLANVTLTGNQSQTGFGGGLYVFSDAHASVNNATLAGNSAALRGGGVFVESSAFIGVSPKIANSIVAGNSAGSEPDCSGPVDSGYDLIGNGAGCVGPAAAKHDLVGALLNPVDAKLGPLGENGGPTPTREPLTGSPALGAGNPAAPGAGSGACEATDQRGAPRPGGIRCDIGAFEGTAACVPGGGTLCLNNGRFQVTAIWQTASGAGPGQGVTLTGDSGYFWFFDPGNVELTVKVLNGCALGNHYWVFASGLTNVRVDLIVTDTKSGAAKTYFNPLGRVFRSILDTGAFATCP